MKLSIILVYGFIALTVMTFVFVSSYYRLLSVIGSIIAHLTHNSDRATAI